MKVTIAEKFKCVERELALRRSAYPKWVGSGRMSADRAHREIEIMEAVVEDYRKQLMDFANA